MTYNRIDQLIFGYLEGHRLLGGSTKIPVGSLAVLLGATDVPIDSSIDRLVTGLPLDEIARYALCFTWGAPEVPRLGAVWSHVLLAEPQCFESPASVDVLQNLAHRPEANELDHYNTPLSLTTGETAVRDVSPSLIEAIVTAAYGDGESVVVHNDLAESEEALFAVWQAQWPSLRSRFKFCTRESARVSSNSGVVVARKVRGMRRMGDCLQRKAWITQLSNSIVAKQKSPLRQFLETFGPVDLPESSTVADLARLHTYVESGNCAAVRDAIEARYPNRYGGRGLKEQLFGRLGRSWWSVPESSRLGAILGANLDAWDPEVLNLGQRLSDSIQKNGVGRLLNDLSKDGPESIRVAFLNAVIQSGEASDLPLVARSSPKLAAIWLSKKPYIGREPDAWRSLGHDQAEAVLTQMGSPDSESVLAAAVAGHAQTAIKILGLSTALACAAGTKNFTAATALLQASSWSSATRVSVDNAEITLLLGVISEDRDVPMLLTALETRRNTCDEIWLKAATVAISKSDQVAGSVLEIVFGPLHHAITDDRLPTECWDSLNRVLPDDPDPALRLRKLLVRVAKKEGWRQKEYKRALRGAGPYASEIYREFDDGDLILGKIKKFIES